MKKIALYIFMLFLAAPLAFSADDKKEEKKQETQIEIKERLLKNVSTKDNGDILVAMPVKDKIKKVKYPYSLALLASYVDPDFDVGLYNKMMSEKESELIKETLEIGGKFFKKKGLNLKDMKYSQGTVQKLLDNGLPLFAYAKKDETTLKAIAKRSKTRPSDKEKMNEWKSVLKKNEEKKINYENIATPLLIMGFNKDTREYYIRTESYGFMWILESELKDFLLYLYQVRY